jgi:peptidoglycan-N-acetylglucosamine deacetylase
MKRLVFLIVLFASVFLFASLVHDKLNLEQVITHEKRTKLRVAITDDDGPNEFSHKVFQIVKKYGKMSIFVSGKAAEKYPELIKEANELGFSIGIHGYSHKMMSKLSWQEQEKELEESSKVVEKIIGEKPTLFRPPWGSFNENTQELLMAHGMHLVNWDVDSMDHALSNLSEKEIIDRVLSQVKPGSIVLFHDADEFGNPREKITKVLPAILEELKKRGYEFVTVDELLEEPDAADDTVGSFFYGWLFCLKNCIIEAYQK